MAALSAATTKQVSLGSLKRLVFTFSSVSDADTFASGLGSDVVSFVYQVTADPTVNTSSGANVSESSGAFTFFPGVDALSGILTVDVERG